MRYVYRLIATLTGCGALFIAAATVAYARIDEGGGGGGVIVSPRGPTIARITGTSYWELAAFVGLGALLALAIVGLAYSLRHRRMAAPSRQSGPSQGARV